MFSDCPLFVRPISYYYLCKEFGKTNNGGASIAKGYPFAKYYLGGLAPKPLGKDLKMKNTETNKTRTVKILFRVTAHERELIRDRMKMCGIKNMARFLRLMAINGCIINTDYSELKARNYELHKIGVNINQIAKRVNETDHLHSGDVEKLQEMMDAIWQSQKYILSEEP